MSRPKIYISKSKNVKKDVLDKVLGHLSLFDVDVTYYEGDKEAYSHKKLDQADLVLVLSHTLPKPFNYEFFVSKEVYSEIDYLFHENDKPVLGVICVGDQLYVSPVEDFDLEDGSDWKGNYGYVRCVDIMKNLDNVSDFEEYDGPLINPKDIEELFETSAIQKYSSKPKPMLALYGM